ncbi:MAG TPA: Vms1/Ankzf1 family peptidyl-tRNA hydrolase [Vicinamibacterales bacterium]|nr:Vms1/Ankzf1 family peptidyl-tRNA hydrolase [Vicinamibacterales bacterium]
MEILAALEPSPFPVISLYLSLKPNQNGREDFDVFVRKVFPERAKSFRQNSPERDSFDQDAERIRQYLASERDPSWQGVAIFACAGAQLFEAIPLETPFDDHWMFVGSVPHLYPLAKLVDTYPRYAAVMVDTNKARILVFSLAATEREERIVNDKTRRSSQGGWSQARYQRRADNVHLHHMKEVAEALERIVREEHLNQIVVAADEVALPKLREQLPAHLAEKIVATVPLQRNAPGSALEDTLAEIWRKDAESDAEKVQELFDEWLGSGLGVTGPEATLRAFELGQVEELIITGAVETLKPVQTMPANSATEMQADTSAPQGGVDESRLKLSAELIKRAQQTAARIRFIEDASLLEEVGGVGALLRFRI